MPRLPHLAAWHARLQRRLGRSVTGARLVLKLRNQCNGVVHHFFNEGCLAHENGEQAVVEAFGPDCTTFVDIGANVGNWSESFLQIARKPLRGLVADPSTSALRSLREKFSQDSRITVRDAAFSDHVGEAHFFEEPAAGETSSLVAGFSRTDSRARTVPVTTLDREVEALGWPRVDFLKVDAEGHDLHVLRGAKELLRAGRIGVVQFEYNTPWKLVGSRLSEAVGLLQESGYRVFLIKQAGLIQLQTSEWMDYHDYSNYLAVHRDQTIPASLPVHAVRFHFW